MRRLRALPYWIMTAAGLVIQLFLAGEASAQHPIEVERSAASADYFKALVAFDKLPSRRATAAAIAAAGKSAWALGLSERATREFDKALRAPDLNADERARLLLSRGIVEFQEARYQVASLYAERALEQLPQPSPLRSQVWFLWGESLMRSNMQGMAEEKYLHAAEEAASVDQPQVYFRLGECRFKLGKLGQARESFEKIPLQHEQAPHAIRYLAEVALQQKRYEQASFWLEHGREKFPEKFLDSWVDYALMQSAIYESQESKVRDLADAASKRYPPSDSWNVLLQAAAEAYLWSSAKSQPLAPMRARIGQVEGGGYE